MRAVAIIIIVVVVVVATSTWRTSPTTTRSHGRSLVCGRMHCSRAIMADAIEIMVVVGVVGGM